ncbi:MAG: aldo/keto reductase, partial [Scrofimicrobium sp.]
MNDTVRTELQGGVELPKIGLGTYRLNGESGARAIDAAIGAGYRLIDSAFNYDNEGAVGQAVRNTEVPREELIITSKLAGRYHAYDQARDSIEESLFRLGLDQIDLYLIHWPLPKVDKYVEAWEALVNAQQRGIVRWIGVSNFLPEHIERLEKETGVLPAVNQLQLHPYFPDTEAVEYNASRGIITEAWSPLGRGRELLDEPVIKD